MKGNSDVASNRVVKVKDIYGFKTNQNVRYSRTHLNEAYFQFPLKKFISFSTFRKYLPNIYKHPYRWTDMCDYCGYALKKNLKQIANKYEYATPMSINIMDEITVLKNLIIFLKTKQEIDAIKNAKDYIEILFHKNNAKRQRAEFNKNRKDKDLLNRSNLIIFDYKEKVRINTSLRQTNGE
jgi:hypothetical protein